MEIKINERKNTTETGINELINLVESFGLDADIKTVCGCTFKLEADIGGDYKTSFSDQGEIRIIDGNVEIYGWVDEYGYQPEKLFVPWNIKKIDFGGAIKSLEGAIKKYNTLTAEKDAQIEKFLAICNELK